LFRAVFAILVVAVAADAQPRSIDAWGNIGAGRVGGDEGWNGSGVMYGGGVSIPLTERIAIEADVSRISVDRFGSSSHTFVSPAVVWRWGTDRVYGFAGAGMGVVANRGTAFEPIFFPGQPPTYVRSTATEYNATLHGRGGVVFSPAERWLVRTELFSAWQYALPSFGVKVGVGYRFR
jgi:hypothetical protein